MLIELSNFRIDKQIGEGGMATVYRAVQKSLERAVALKVLNPLHSNTPQFTQRFLNEGRIVASLAHSNIVTIHDIGVESGLHFIAMELLTGGDLKQRIREGVSVETALQHVETIAGALGAAHRLDIVHRDVKPTNVLFRADGTLVLSDFGIAKRLGGGDDLTIAGSTIGSPHYLSPEQARGQPVDARADIYSLGVLLYEMLTGAKPYRGASDIDTVLMHVSKPVPTLPERFAALQPLIERMLAKSAEDRFESTAAVIAALRQARPALRGEVAGHTPDTVLQTREDTRTVDLGFHEAVTVERAPVQRDPGFHEAATLERVPDGRAPGSHEASTALDAPARATGRGPLLIGAALLLATVAVGAWFALRDGGEAPQSVVHTPAAGSAPQAAATPAATPEPPTPPPGTATAETAPPPPAPAAPEPAPTATTSAAVPPLQSPPPASATSAGPNAPPAAAAAAPTVDAADRDARVAALLAQADRAMADFRLTLPAGDNALAYIEQALTLDPGSVAARAAFSRIADRYVVLARGSLDKGQQDKARVFVDRGLEVNPDNAELRALDAQLARAPARTEEQAAGAGSKRVEGESPTQLFNRVKRFFTN